MDSKQELKPFFDGVDTVSAYSVEDAMLVLKETYGYSDDDLEGAEFEEMSPFENITITWVDGDFLPGREGIEYPALCTVEFVATYKSFGSNGPRFDLEKVSFQDGHIRVSAQAGAWAKLRRGIICSSEY